MGLHYSARIRVIPCWFVSYSCATVWVTSLCDIPHPCGLWHHKTVPLCGSKICAESARNTWGSVKTSINLIDPNTKHTYRLLQCPTAMKDEFHTKLNRYVNARWWEPQTTSQAAPLRCVPKKDGKLRTVIDARQRNKNTVKDVTPLPDQETIREDVARAPIRLKINLADAYEQAQVHPTDIDKTAFSTIAGIFVSHVVQQGDCNALKYLRCE